MKAVLRGATNSQNVGDRMMSSVAEALLGDLGFDDVHRLRHKDTVFDHIAGRDRVSALFDLGNIAYSDCLPEPVGERIERSIASNDAFPNATRVFLPCGWGPFPDAKSLERLRVLLKDAVIFAREPISLAYIQEAVGPEHAALCPDLAFLCDREDPQAGEHALEELGLRPGPPLLGLVPNARCVDPGVTPSDDPSTYLDTLREAVDWARGNGFAAIGISHSVDSDRDLRLLEPLGIPILRSDDPLTVRSVLANLSLAVCSRYHAVVNCLLHGIPPICIGWQHKYTGQMQAFGLEAFDQTLSEGPGALSKRLAEAAEAREVLAAQIAVRLEETRAILRREMTAVGRRFGRPEVLGPLVKFDGRAIEPPSPTRRRSKGVFRRVLRELRRLGGSARPG